MGPKDFDAARVEMHELCRRSLEIYPGNGTPKGDTAAGRRGGAMFGQGAAHIAIKYGLTKGEGKVIADGVLRHHGLLHD